MNDIPEDVKDKIDAQDPWYTDSHFAYAGKEQVKRIYARRREFFLGILDPLLSFKKNITLLDYGCGDGYWSLQFSRLSGCRVTGVDYNPLRIERAREKVRDAEFFELDLTKEAGTLGKFDIVFCSQVIEHIKDDVGFLMNIKNYLKDDGILILGTTNEGCFTQDLSRRFKKQKTDHVHFYVESEIRAKIQLAGYEIKEIFREVFFPGSEGLYNKLLRKDWGFSMLEALTKIFPSQCSDYYFECSLGNLIINADFFGTDRH